MMTPSINTSFALPKSIALAAVAALSLSLASPVMAQTQSEGSATKQGGAKMEQGYKKHGKRRGGGMLGRFCSDEAQARQMEMRTKIGSELGLTGEQQALFQAFSAQTDQATAALAPTCAKIEASRSQGEQDRSAKREMRQEIRGEVEAATQGLRETRKSFMESLSDEQRAQMRELFPKRGGKDGKRGQRSDK